MGLTLAWLPLQVTILLTGGTIFFSLVLIYPLIGLYTLIGVIPFSSLVAVPLGEFKAGIMEIVLALTALSGLLRIVTSRHLSQPIKVRTGPLLWPFLVLLGALSLSWLNAFSISATLIESIKWVEMFVLYLFVINFLPPQRIKWLVLIFIAAGLAQAGIGLYQFIFKVGPAGFLLFDGQFLRAYGTFAQPNPYGGYLGLLLPLFLSLTIWALERGQKTSSLYPPEVVGTKWLLDASRDVVSRLNQLITVSLVAMPLGLLLAALFASQSRGAWLGFVGASGVMLMVRSKKVTISLTLLAMVATFLGLIASFGLSFAPAAETSTVENAYGAVARRFTNALTIIDVTDIASTPVNDANFANIERLAHWQAARDMWRDNPWLGVGFGNYAVIYPAYAVGRWLDPLGHAHNYLLNIGAETGLVGITAYLIFWIYIFGLLSVIVQLGSCFEKAVAVGSLGIIVHLHIHNLVDNLYVQGMYLHVAIILGLVSILYQHGKSGKSAKKT